MNEESRGSNPEGLYRNPATKQEIGCLHPSQADAVVRQGFVLVREGLEAAKAAGQSAAKPPVVEPSEKTPEPEKAPAPTTEIVKAP